MPKTKTALCVDCGKPIWAGGARCRSCATKNLWVAGTYQSKCLAKKTAEEKKATAFLWKSNHPETMKAISKRSNAKNRATHRAWNLQERYGITADQFEEMLSLQERLCALCGKPMLKSHDTCVDHDHETNHVRGIIHRKCNQLLGMAEDGEQRLLQAVSYLRHFRSCA